MLCRMHYERWYRRGEPVDVCLKFPRQTRLCGREGCVSKNYCRGLCIRHYSAMKARARGVPQRIVTHTCTVPGCGRRHRAKGLCINHYNMQRMESGHHTLMHFLGLESWR